MITAELIEQYRRLILHSEGQKYAIAVKQGNEVKYPHQQNYLSEAELNLALKGDRSLGIMLAQDKTSLVKAGAIDIDCPRDAKDLTEGLAKAKRLQESALKFNLRGYIEFSGLRGYHFWILVERAVTASLMQSVLKAIANEANFEALEIFPNSIPESKCIKLPGVIHLKSGIRCGFVDEDFEPLNPTISIEKQASRMASFEQNDVGAIAKVANLASDNSSQPHQSNEGIAKKLNQFGNSHPACITHLLNTGSPLEIDYNQANLTLVRYCIRRGFNLQESLNLAESMARNTSEAHPTSKDYQGKISNFKSAFNSASRNRDDYKFQCSYILANLGDQPLSSRGCIGSKCSVCDWSSNGNGKSPSTPKKLPLNRLIFHAMINLSSQGKECCKSLIMFEVEKLIDEANLSDNKGDIISDSFKLIESEVLSYLIKFPQNLSDYLEIFPQGFRSLTTQPLCEYFDYLANLDLPSSETIEAHLDYIREQGIKVIATRKFSEYSKNLKQAESVEVLNKSIEDSEKLLKRSLNDKQILPVLDHLASIAESLFTQESVSLATTSPHLNNVLNGGFQLGKLYVIGAPPASGKSTFCAWCGDYAAANGARVIYASYEMSREQLVIASLSRIGGLNSAVIESKKYLDEDYHARESLEARLIDTFRQYEKAIAPNLTIICNDLKL